MEQQILKFRNHIYEEDEQFSADGYLVSGYRGIAWSILGWELEEDEDTEWTGQYTATGKLLAIMKGDDRVFTFDEDEFTALTEDQFCPECGQTGCKAYH